jgi:hypothetical protein
MIATVALAADVAATLDLSDRSEVRTRSTPQLGASGAAGTSSGAAAPFGVDLLTRPEARLRTTDRRWDCSFGYSASLVVPDVELGFAPQVLQLGNAAVTWHDRLVRVTVQEDATYGTENSAFLLPTVQTTPGQPPPAAQAAPAPATLTYGYSRTQLSTVIRLDRRTRAIAGVDYLLSGGLDDASRQLLPLQLGPHATAQLEYALSRRDSLVTAASAQQADFSAGPCLPTVGTGTCQLSDRLAQLTETYKHALSRSSTASLVGGVAVASVRFRPGDPYGSSYYPAAEASLVETFGARGASSLSLFARVAPFMDVRTGIVLETVQGDVTLGDRLSRHVTLRLAAGGSQNVPTSNPAAATIVHGDFGVDYHVDPTREGATGEGVTGSAGPIDLSMGERWFWQQQNGFGAFVSAFGYVAVTVRERTLHW